MVNYTELSPEDRARVDKLSEVIAAAVGAALPEPNRAQRRAMARAKRKRGR